MIYIAVLNNLIVNGSARFLNKLYANDVDIGSNLNIIGNIEVEGTLDIGNNMYLNNKLALRGFDTYLRLNDTGAFTNGVYFGTSRVRTDNSFEVGNGSSLSFNATMSAITLNKPTTINSTLSVPNIATITTLNTDQVNVDNIDAENVDVKYKLKASHYDLQTVSQLGGVFRVAPSISIPSTVTPSTNVKTTSVTVTKSSSSATITIVDNSINNGDSQGDISTTTPYIGGITWASGAYIMCSGTIGDVVTGTMFGKITTINTNSRTLTLNITSGYDGLVAGTYSASQISGLTVVLYKNHSNYPVGIELNSYGTSVGRTYIDVYGGTSNEPSVRIGNIGGLSYNGGTLENQWGIYTDNGYFKGAIVSTEGKIGGFTIDGTKLYSNGHSAYNTAKSGVYIGTDYISFGSGGVTYFKDDGTGKIGKWTVGVNDLYNGTIGNTTSALVSVGTSSNANIGGSGASAHTWSFTAGSKFGVTNTGDLYANSANIQGKIEATSGTIGGWSINNSYGIYTNNKTSATSTNTGILIQKDGAIYAGAYNSTKGSCPFQVTASGALIATSAEITGGVVANTGSIGGWTIDTSSISSNNSTSIKSIVAGTRTASSTGDGVYIGSNGVLNVGKASGNYLTFDGTNLDLKTDWLEFDSSTSIVRIGQSNESHLDIDYHSMQLKDEDNSYFHVSDFRDRNGEYTSTESFSGNGSTTWFEVVYAIYSVTSITIDGTLIDSADYNYSVGDAIVFFDTAPSTNSTIVIKYITKSDHTKAYTLGVRRSGAIGGMSIVEGYDNLASGECSHAEGLNTTANGHYCHSEGHSTVASFYASHAEGLNTSATGYASHTEGYANFANGNYCHAEGYQTTANGSCSHTQNRGTVATEDYQTVIGKYNTATLTSGNGTTSNPYTYSDVGDYAFIIGNGTGNETANRSNALTVDWSGNLICNNHQAGIVARGTTSTTVNNVTTSWRYRRWSDNVLELWATTTITPSAANKATTKQLNFPFYIKNFNGQATLQGIPEIATCNIGLSPLLVSDQTKYFATNLNIYASNTTTRTVYIYISGYYST